MTSHVTDTTKESPFKGMVITIPSPVLSQRKELRRPHLTADSEDEFSEQHQATSLGGSFFADIVISEPILEARKESKTTHDCSFNNSVPSLAKADDDSSVAALSFIQEPKDTAPVPPQRCDSPPPPPPTPQEENHDSDVNMPQNQPPAGQSQIEQNQPATEQCQIKIAPGVEMPLLSARDIWQAVKHDDYNPVKCSCCEQMIFCVSSAPHVICPTCQVVGPNEAAAATATYTALGVAMGFTFRDLGRWQQEILRQATCHEQQL